MMDRSPRLCLIEDDVIMGESLCDRFTLEGLAFDWHRDGHSALRSIGRESYSAIISDVRLPDLDGEDLLRTLLASGMRLPPFLFITAYGSVNRAVEAVKLGAADYITKPFDIEQLIQKTRELIGTQQRRETGGIGDPVLGVSTAIRRIEELLPRLAGHSETALITGESGVGKERVAQLLHALHPGSAVRPFVAVNCSALTESLLESELFGHERGAFTGAGRSRRGLFEQAEGGTLFLDEIGDMSPLMQAKLLRAIQERQIMRVGGERAIAVNLRLICATNKDLGKLVERGHFREDLFYRVNVIRLRIPPLRERQDDVLWLARRFLARMRGCVHAAASTESAGGVSTAALPLARQCPRAEACRRARLHPSARSPYPALGPVPKRRPAGADRLSNTRHDSCSLSARLRARVHPPRSRRAPFARDRNRRCFGHQPQEPLGETAKAWNPRKVSAVMLVPFIGREDGEDLRHVEPRRG